jgi:hypothetical protein
MVTAKASGGKDLDWSSLAGGQRISAGLDPWQRVCVDISNPSIFINLFRGRLTELDCPSSGKETRDEPWIGVVTNIFHMVFIVHRFPEIIN